MVRKIVSSVLALVVLAPLAGSAGSAVARSIMAGSDVAVVGEAILAGPATVAKTAAPVPGCTDATYALAKWKVAKTFEWSYNGKGAPASVAATALTAIRNASQTVASGRNKCGATATLTTKQVYKGTSTRTAQVSAKGTCTGNDNVSVVSWGTLPPTYLAYTCVYYRPSTGAVLSSDMLIDNKVHRWATKLPSRCSNVFDLESVAVHERGHTAGLDHVNQTSHAPQLMSPKAPACSTAKRLLAAGDLAGLKVRYK